jgi:NOL1/NOP2/sun family putative RNA methylase
MNLPKLFEDRMKELLGDEYEEFLQCYDKPHFGGLRVNTLKITPKEFEQICPFTIHRIPWVQNGYYYDTKEQPSKHPYYYAGLYYIQEPSAMTPASLLPINKGDKVLDICAAPGGKSTELGAKLGGDGLLVSNDISNSRAKALLKNIELFGIRNALILSEAPNKLVQYFPEYFDKILIDAPCSGEGMFRKSPAIMKNWEQYGVDYYNKLQKEIILFAARMLKPGGYMLYSTCTFSPEENEGTIAYLLEQYPEFQVVNAIPDEQTQRELELSYDGTFL